MFIHAQFLIIYKIFSKNCQTPTFLAVFLLFLQLSGPQEGEDDSRLRVDTNSGHHHFPWPLHYMSAWKLRDTEKTFFSKYFHTYSLKKPMIKHQLPLFKQTQIKIAYWRHLGTQEMTKTLILMLIYILSIELLKAQVSPVRGCLI